MPEEKLLKITQIASIPVIIILLYLELRTITTIEQQEIVLLERMEELIINHCQADARNKNH